MKGQPWKTILIAIVGVLSLAGSGQAVTQIVLFDGITQKPKGNQADPGWATPVPVELGGWGSGTIQLEKLETGGSILRVETDGYYRGGALTLKQPVAFGAFLNQSLAFLEMDCHFLKTETSVGGTGMGPGGAGGMMGQGAAGGMMGGMMRQGMGAGQGGGVMGPGMMMGQGQGGGVMGPGMMMGQGQGGGVMGPGMMMGQGGGVMGPGMMMGRGVMGQAQGGSTEAGQGGSPEAGQGQGGGMMGPGMMMGQGGGMMGPGMMMGQGGGMMGPGMMMGQGGGMMGPGMMMGQGGGMMGPGMMMGQGQAQGQGQQGQTEGSTVELRAPQGGAGQGEGMAAAQSQVATSKLRILLETDEGPLILEDYEINPDYIINGWTKIVIPLSAFLNPRKISPNRLKRVVIFGDSEDEFYIGRTRFVVDDDPIQVGLWPLEDFDAPVKTDLVFKGWAFYGNFLAAPVSLSLDLGDGTVINLTDEKKCQGVANTFAVTHKYTQEGDFTVTLTVTDPKGLKEPVSKTVVARIR